MISCAVFGEPNGDTLRRLEYLIKAFPKNIDIRTTKGETALQMAFELARCSAAKMLLEAGADAETHDTVGNNLIHKLFSMFRPYSSEGLLDQLKSMLELLDPETRYRLLLQRNSASVTQSGETPLHSWLASSIMTDSAVNLSKTKAVVDLILSYSDGDELTVINGAGDTPLHTLIAKSQFALVEHLLEHNPGLLHRENATGRTPLEQAHDKWTTLKLSNPPTFKNDSHYTQQFGYNYDSDQCGIQSIADMRPDHFVKSPGSSDKRSAEQKTWDLCREFSEKYPQKRKLVTLNEANEFVRRISEGAGEPQQYGRGFYRVSRKRVMDGLEREEQAQVKPDPLVSFLGGVRSWEAEIQ